MNKEDEIRLVNRLDHWAQLHDRALDERLADIYSQAGNVDSGWSSVRESSPLLFAEVLAIAKDMD